MHRSAATATVMEEEVVVMVVVGDDHDKGTYLVRWTVTGNRGQADETSQNGFSSAPRQEKTKGRSGQRSKK